MMKSMDDNNNSNFSLGFSLSPNMKMGFPGYADVNFSSGFHNHPSQFSVMPIKSDGSLCIMEALSRSQPQASSPKLENFLGSERETMPLSLDSIYYQQQITTEDQEELNRQQQQHSIEAFQQQQQQQQQNHHYYNTGSLMNGCSAQISQIPTWASRSYSTQHAMEHPQMGNANLTDITQISSTEVDCLSMETKKRGIGKVGQKQTVHRKSIDTFGQRTSQYRGVTKHRWTGRYEAHLWDNSCKKEGQTRKGRQVYLGGYDMEEKAARSYDLAALKYWGPSTHINFPLENYKDQLEDMKNMTRQEFVAHLRRKSSGFSRGASMYRGVTRHHQHGRWQARIGRVAGNKDLYLGTFSTQEEAAEAYDIAAIKFRGANAVTNFDITRYDVEKIMSSNTLLASEQAKRVKAFDHIASPQITGDPNSSNSDWKMVLSDHFPQQQQLTDTHHKQESMISVGNYQGSNFLQDMIGTNSLSSASDSNKMGSVQFSNASSIVTSLNSSREGSPADKSGSSPNINMLFPMAPVSWISPPTAIPMSHLPVYAAWTDA